MPQPGPITDKNAITSKRADTSNYVVYPKNRKDHDQTTALGQLLQSVVLDSNDLIVHGSVLGVAFWSVPLTCDAAQKVADDPNVGALVKADECTEDCADPTDSSDPDLDNPRSIMKRSGDKIVHEKTTLVKRDDGLVNSHKIDPEMVFVSLPDQAKVEDYEDFVYDKSAGTGVTVYIVDTGADLRNDDEFSKHVRQNVRWLHAFGDTPQDTTQNDIKGVGHGTGILAKVAGWKHGLAKRSNPVVVRVNKNNDPAAWLDGVVQAYNDWRTNHYLGHPIAPAGNTKRDEPPNGPVDRWPQLFAYGDPADVPDMMVVGGMGIDGERWERSKTDPPNQGSVIKVYAPSFDLTIPNASTGGYRYPAEVQGVSYGLSSLSDSFKDDDPTKRVQKLKEELQTGSCIFRDEEDKICGLNNLADPEKCPPDVPDDFEDGDEVGCFEVEEISGGFF
ncbi:MAG: hypothetical protein Q9169_004371 [Polycauliona sp. 2 TL-2023]